MKTISQIVSGLQLQMSRDDREAGFGVPRLIQLTVERMWEALERDGLPAGDVHLRIDVEVPCEPSPSNG